MTPIQPFAELALLLFLTAFIGALALRLRQPMLMAFMVVGILAGPSGLGIVHAHDQLDLLAQIGVAVLLFLVGLRLDLKHVRHIGPVALATGLGQLAFTILFGFLLLLLLGRDAITALYVAVALTFSSTIIIVKLLADKRELDTLHGRIAVGFLIVQDIAVVLAMLVMSSLGVTQAEATASTLTMLGSILVRLGVAGLLLYLAMRYVLPPLVRQMARSQELLLIFAVAWGTGLAALGEWAGFSKEAGAFLAGFSLASTPYRDAMSARLVGLRDFLLLFFFIDLGAKLDFSTLDTELGQAVVLALFVLIGNPLIVMAIMGWMGYRKRTGFLAGLTVAQISEFSIVFVAMGVTLGHVGQEALGLTTLVGIITIALSTYMIIYSHTLYERLRPWLGILERRVPHRECNEEDHDANLTPRLILFGLGRYGEGLFKRLHAARLPILGVDFDPEVVERLRAQGLPVAFGDAEDPSLLESLPLGSAAWMVTTLPDARINQSLLEVLPALGFQGKIAAVVREPKEEQPMRQAGVALILNPFHDAIEHAAKVLTDHALPREGEPRSTLQGRQAPRATP